MAGTEVADREATKQEFVSSLRELVKGKEKLALDVFQEMLDELFAGVQPSTGSECPVCKDGTLHYWTTRMVFLQGLGDKSRVAQVLTAIKKAKEDGWLLGRVERTLGDIPTLNSIRVEAPLYICTNPECDGLTLSIFGNDRVEVL